MTAKQPDFTHSSDSRRREAPLAGRVVAVTGAASGIGRALSLDCAARGARLALADIDGAALAEVRSELQARGTSAADVFTFELDVRERSHVFAWAAEVEARLGPAQTLVNAAGVALHCPLDETTFEDFEWVMATNFWGTVHSSQAFLPQLKRAASAHVVNVSSVFGLFAFPASGAYVASKFAVRGFTEALSLEMSLTHPNVSVTSVHPGGIRTPLVRRGRVRGRGPLARTAEQVALAFDRDVARTSPEACAAHIVRVIDVPRRRLLIGGDALLIDGLVRLFPSFYQPLLAWILRRGREPSPSEGR